MRIRDIEIVGFKSFREPTRLTFSPGVNAIVGPNGCGKSNVSDAIRWVLGEQSPKHLRARGMEDVIFGGNAKSPALNFAEVSLTFERADGSPLGVPGEQQGLAAQVSRLTEFTVTRRIFRSGESHYLINQSPARLRDITELFLGSGVGPKAYAMVEQGRVEQIVNAKPEDLRLFIEEAAGTTLFRSRKLAAERKLERTTENLSRVQDVTREIERQMSALRRQAKRAEEFKALESELRATEIALAAERWRRLDRERQSLEAEEVEALQALRGLQRELGEHEAAREVALGEEQAARREVESAMIALSEASSEVIRITERRAAIVEALKSLRARMERGSEDMAALDVRSRENAAELAAADAQCQESAGRLGAAERDLAWAEAAVAERVPRFEQAEGEQASAAAALNDARSRAALVASRRAECGARLAGLREEHARMSLRLEERSRELAHAESRTEAAVLRHETAVKLHQGLSDRRSDAILELRAREEEVRRLEESVAAVREAMLQVRGRLDGLREREQAFDGYADGVAAVLGRESCARGLVIDTLSIPPGLEQAVAAALGETLRGVVVDGPEEGAAIGEELHRRREGRVALVPAAPRCHARAETSELPAGTRNLGSMIGARPGSEELSAALFEGIALADDLPTAVAAWRSHGDGYTWITPAGDVVDCHGTVTGGQAPASADLLQRRRSLGELTAQIAEDEVRLAALELRLGEVRQECGERAAALDALDSEAHRAALDLVACEHEREAAGRERAAATARAEEARAELGRVQGLEEAAQAALGDAEAEAAAARGAVSAAEANASLSEGRLREERGAMESARRRQDEARLVVSAAREALTRADGEIARLNHAAMLDAARRDVLDTDRRRLGEESELQNEALAALDRDLVRARDRVTEHEAEANRRRETVRSAEQALAVAEAALARTRSLVEEAREQHGSLEVRVAERRAQLEALVTNVLERYAVAVDTSAVPEGFDAEASGRRIAELKERIARLGDVNVTAIADVRELEERYEFLAGQRSDLEASMEDLRRTIAELSRTTRARFRETFEQANERFQALFLELFRGGHALLKLSEPHNLLDSGVELEVQPPGKKVGNLAMLSGGEKALTAVSLIMALFTLRATPFCLLDEVDAPLDDANVGRFNAMIRRMSELTQFIVITHNKRTMEGSDVLYGVTMGEAGVSQIVSVRMPVREEKELLVASA